MLTGMPARSFAIDTRYMDQKARPNGRKSIRERHKPRMSDRAAERERNKIKINILLKTVDLDDAQSPRAKSISGVKILNKYWNLLEIYEKWCVCFGFKRDANINQGIRMAFNVCSGQVWTISSTHKKKTRELRVRCPQYNTASFNINIEHMKNCSRSNCCDMHT